MSAPSRPSLAAVEPVTQILQLSLSAREGAAESWVMAEVKYTVPPLRELAARR